MIIFIALNHQSSSMSEPSPERVAQFLTNIELVTYIDVASLMLLVYDHALTLSREVDLVWKKSLTPITLVFTLNRYLPYIDNAASFIHGYTPKPTITLCANLIRLQMWLMLIGVAIADIVLLVRTIAIWRGDRRIGTGLSVLMIIIAVVVIYFTNSYLQGLSVFPNFLTKYPTCAASTITNNNIDHLVICYAVLLGYEAAVLLLTLMRAHKYQTGTLFKRLYIDGITFFIYLCVISIINMVVMIATLPELQLSLIMVHRNVHSILTGRIILNIRRIVAGPTVPEVHPLPVIRFSGRSAPSRLTGLTDLYSTRITDASESDPSLV